MGCEFDDGNGWCTGRFYGFACIKDKCDVHGDAGEGINSCPSEPVDGRYCRRYNRFFCAGREVCNDESTYNRMMEMERWGEGIGNQINMKG